VAAMSEYYTFNDEWDITVDCAQRVILVRGRGIRDIKEIYCRVYDIFDELIYMDEVMPMIALTPWDYRMYEDWQLQIDNTFYMGNISIKMTPEELASRI
jgi:hypothetical protein